MARNWRDLSPSYRQRLLSNGISKQDYEKGISLSAARGHGKTPERPERASRSPERFQDYLGKRSESGSQNADGSGVSRAQWARRYVRNLDRELGHKDKYNRRAIIERTQIKDPDNPRYIPTEDLIWGATASEPELITRISGYSGHRINPFYYH